MYRGPRTASTKHTNRYRILFSASVGLPTGKLWFPMCYIWTLKELNVDTPDLSADNLLDTNRCPQKKHSSQSLGKYGTDN